jgi:hypothetical protein
MGFLKGIYVVAIAVLLIVLVMVGIEAFYPPPPYPEHPEWPVNPHPYDSPEYEEWYREWREEWQRIDDAYRQELAVHHRNVFSVILPLGALFAVGGTLVRRRFDMFGAGLILGGMGTMIYAVVLSDLDSRLRFVGVAAALAVLVFVGYKVFHALRRH